MTYADTTPVVGRSRNEATAPAVPATPPPIASTLPPRPRACGIRIRVYDFCAEHGAHTDPQLLAREETYL